MKSRSTILSLVVVLILSACSPRVKTQPAPDLVTVQLKWIHQAQFAGFYMALEKGFYADENLQVTLLPGGVGVDIVDEVVSGRADFGIVGAEYLILNRGAGKPVKAIATTFRNNPFVLVTMPDSGITDPYDFPGHSANIGAIDGLIQFEALLYKLDIDINQIEILPYSYNLDDFYNGSIDITPAFSAGSLIEIREQHPDVNVIWPIDYGIHLYSDTIFSTDNLIEDNSDLVLRFLRATLKGHQYAIDHPEEAVEIALKFAQNPDPTIQRQMLDASIPLIYTGEDEIGWMKKDVWQGMYNILDQQGLINRSFDLNEVYTTKFLEEIYRGAP
jgi:NitT/TauT family transport system substrate-binding protein